MAAGRVVPAAGKHQIAGSRADRSSFKVETPHIRRWLAESAYESQWTSVHPRQAPKQRREEANRRHRQSLAFLAKLPNATAFTELLPTTSRDRRSAPLVPTEPSFIGAQFDQTSCGAQEYQPPPGPRLSPNADVSASDFEPSSHGQPDPRSERSSKDEYRRQSPSACNAKSSKCTVGRVLVTPVHARGREVAAEQQRTIPQRPELAPEAENSQGHSLEAGEPLCSLPRRYECAEAEEQVHIFEQHQSRDVAVDGHADGNISDSTSSSGKSPLQSANALKDPAQLNGSGHYSLLIPSIHQDLAEQICKQEERSVEDICSLSSLSLSSKGIFPDYTMPMSKDSWLFPHNDLSMKGPVSNDVDELRSHETAFYVILWTYVGHQHGSHASRNAGGNNRASGQRRRAAGSRAATRNQCHRSRGGDNSDGDGGPPQPKRPRASQKPARLWARFACPFHKLNPGLYDRCKSLSWSEIEGVKRHVLGEKHSSHVNLEQEHLIRSIPVSMTGVGDHRWYAIYRRLFGIDENSLDVIPSPYHEQIVDSTSWLETLPSFPVHSQTLPMLNPDLTRRPNRHAEEYRHEIHRLTEEYELRRSRLEAQAREALDLELRRLHINLAYNVSNLEVGLAQGRSLHDQLRRLPLVELQPVNMAVQERLVPLVPASQGLSEGQISFESSSAFVDAPKSVANDFASDTVESVDAQFQRFTRFETHSTSAAFLAMQESFDAGMPGSSRDEAGHTGFEFNSVPIEVPSSEANDSGYGTLSLEDACSCNDSGGFCPSCSSKWLNPAEFQ